MTTTGKDEALVDPTVWLVGGQSAYLHYPQHGDAVMIVGAPVPAGAGLPLYVAARALLRSGAAAAQLAALFLDRNGRQSGGPAAVDGLLPLTASLEDGGGYVTPLPVTRYAATSAAVAGPGGVGAVNVDQVVVDRQAGGPQAWQARIAASGPLGRLGGSFDDLLARPGGVPRVKYATGAVPAPVSGILHAALSTYFQAVLGQVDPQLTAQPLAIWAAAFSVSPIGAPAPAPPAAVPIKTFQVVRAVKPVLASCGGTFSAFVKAWLGAADDSDGTCEALNLAPDASVGGLLYQRMLGYLTNAPSSQPAGLGQPQAQAVADLAAAWAAVPSSAS